MEDAVKIALIVAIPPTITAVAGVFVSWKNKAKLAEVGDKVVQVETKVDGRLEELLRLTRISSEAEGALRGHTEMARTNGLKQRVTDGTIQTTIAAAKDTAAAEAVRDFKNTGKDPMDVLKS